MNYEISSNRIKKTSGEIHEIYYRHYHFFEAQKKSPKILI